MPCSSIVCADEQLVAGATLFVIFKLTYYPQFSVTFQYSSNFPCSFNNWKTTPGFPVFHRCRNADWSWLVYRNQLSFSFKAQTKYVWQWSKQLTACICKHNWWSGYTLLTPTTNNGLDCVSEVIGLMGNSTKCAHWMALVNVENVKSHSSAGNML